MCYCFSRSLAVLRLIACRAIRATSLTLVVIVFGLSWASEVLAVSPYMGYGLAAEPSNTTYWADTAQGVCDKFGQTWSGSSPGYCRFNGPDRYLTFVQVCKSSGGVYFAPDTTKPQAQQCDGTPPPNCSSSELLNKYRGAGVTGPSLTDAAPALICVQGCGYTGGSVMVTFPKAGGGYTYSGRLGVATGQSCTTANYDVIDTVMYDETQDKPPSPLNCADQGKVYGTVNGVGICANAGSIPGSTVTTNESKTSTETSASGVQATPQTESTSYSVGNVNGVAWVTSTVTHGDGSKTQVAQPLDGFCRENPSASPCGGGGGGGGGGRKDAGVAAGGDNCQAQPVCSGDAIQCMMVKQQWHTRCDSNQPSSLSDLGQKLIDNQDPVSNPASKANWDVRPISSSLDQSAFLGGGGLSDKVVTVSGQSITLPFSRLNQYLVWIGHLFVVLSLIGAIRIVLGGFK